MTLIVTYHAIEHGPEPLCIDPALFAEHAAVVAESGAETLTVRELAARLRAGDLPERAVVVTFDDGCASVAECAAPVLAVHGVRATVYCVAGHVGGANDWPTQASWAPRLALASAGALSDLARAGWEIGSHGVAHRPLAQLDDVAVHDEIVASRTRLEELTDADVSTYAWPYGSRPSAPGAALIRETYGAACGGGPAVVRPSSDPYALERVDAHYLRDPERLRRAIEGALDRQITARAMAARMRRLVRADHAVDRQA